MAEALSINVLNSQPILKTPLSSYTVAVNVKLTIDPSSSFHDDDGHSLKIEDAKYTFNAITSQIPSSFFTIVSSSMI